MVILLLLDEAGHGVDRDPIHQTGEAAQLNPDSLEFPPARQNSLFSRNTYA